MAEKSASELIEREEKRFFRRLGRELEKIAEEGLEFNLPVVVIDHVANTERNLGFIRHKVYRHAREGVKQGDGLTMFKARKVRVQAEEEGKTGTQLPVYNSLNRVQRILSTLERPSGPSFEEKDKGINATECSEPNEARAPVNHQQEAPQSTRLFLSLSGPSLEEKNRNVSNQIASHTQPAKNIQCETAMLTKYPASLFY